MKKLFLSGLIALGLLATGCSSDDSIDTPNPDPNAGKYDTYLTLNFESADTMRPEAQANSPKTAGPAAPDTDGNSISSVHVYFVDNTGKITFAAAPPMNPQVASKTKAFEAPTGTFKLFVVVNPNAKTPLKAVGADLNSVIDGVTKAEAEPGYDGGTNFLMTTACDDVNFANLGSSVTITAANNSEGNAASATATVDRVAVKINSKTSGDVTSKLSTELADTKAEGETTPFFTKVDVKGYVLINGNTKFNLFQKWEALTGNVVGTVIETQQGAVYNPVTKFGKVDTDASGNVIAIEDLTLGSTDVFGTQAVFTIENRPAFMEQTKLTASMAQATGIIYHLVVNDGQTFYVYKSKVYTDLAKLKTDNSEFADIDLTTLNSSQKRLKGIKTYENGNMYYSVYIKDQNYKASYKDTDTQYYAVLRNSVYNIAINSIKNIGDDIPGGGEITPEKPNPPIDSDKTYLDVTIEINPWVLNNINVDL